MDALGEIIETLADTRTVAGHPALVAGLQQKEMTVFMLSNQLPFLQIGLPPPAVTGQIDSYCRPDGEHYARRAFKKLNIVAFNDPNDLLSYSIPRSFVERYLDSRMCPAVTNIHINVAERISAFGARGGQPHRRARELQFRRAGDRAHHPGEHGAREKRAAVQALPDDPHRELTAPPLCGS